MSETPITPEDPDIPDEPPPSESEPEVDDQPLGCARQAILQARAQPGRGHHVDLASHPDHGGTVVVLHLQADQRSVLAHVGGAGCGGIGGRGSR